MKTIQLSNDEVELIIETHQSVSEGSWRWGSTDSYVIDRDGSHFLVTVRFHVGEGWVPEGPYTAIEVKPVEVKTINWVKV
jgi:hypothetical protein